MFRPFILLIITLFCRQIASAQVKITSLELHAHQDDMLYSFPLVHTADKKAGDKINSRLQSYLLSNDSVLTDTNTVFEESRYRRYISEDSTGQSGYTDLRYNVEVNNTEILSLSFNIESMGAYPEVYWNYFNFSSKTGEVLTANNLFTSSGMVEIKKIVLRERKKRITAWIGEMKSDTAGNIKDDTAWINEMFAECNAEASLDDFIIKVNSVVFWKEYCFPHVARPYDTDLDIEFSYKEMIKYLIEGGKKMLLAKKK